MVVAGAEGQDRGRPIYQEQVMGAQVSAYEFAADVGWRTKRTEQDANIAIW